MSIDSVQRNLDRTPNFWDKIHNTFDEIGFDKEYISSVKSYRGREKKKYIKDKIWGMMEFTSDEITIIDSPIVQRLRKIHQLGLSYLTYPSAEHSRFTHTLGVAHVVKRLIRSMSDAAQDSSTLRAGDEYYELFNPSAQEHRQLMRSLIHAALLHDTGHLAFSHAGEIAFAQSTSNHETTLAGLSIVEFKEYFADASFNSGLSECISIALCLSPRFRDFYCKLTGEHDVETPIRTIGCFIGGLSYRPEFAGLANIISGAAVDADKIDYLNRDAAECGIPAGVDVSRVFLNTSLVKISDPQIGKLVESKINGGSSKRFRPGYHFIVNSSGIDTYDELANAKAVLYQRVYLHQLTRNAEQVLASAVDCAMCASGAETDVCNWFPLGDDEFLAKLSRYPQGKRLASRTLPKRAFALYRDATEPFIRLADFFSEDGWGSSKPTNSDDSATSPSPPEIDVNHARQTAWRLFSKIVPIDESERLSTTSDLCSQIRQAAVKVRALIDQSPASSSASEVYIGFSPRNTLSPVMEVLVREKNALGYSSRWTKSEELTMADTIGRGIDYFFADSDWVRYVVIACCKVLYDFNATKPTAFEIKEGSETLSFETVPRISLRLQDICSRIGIDYRQTVDDMKNAAKKKFFGPAERVVPLDETQLKNCEDIVALYAGYEGERGWSVTLGSTSTFLRQFPVALRDEIIGVLKQGIVLDRGRMRRALDEVVSAFSMHCKSRLLLCRLSPNSGANTQLRYEQDVRDGLMAQGHRFARSLGEVEEAISSDTPDGLLWIDDQFASGSQAHAQVLHWAQVPKDQWPQDIQSEININNDPLGEQTRRFFQERAVAFGFAYGTKVGKVRVESVAGKLGFHDFGMRFSKDLEDVRPTISHELSEFLKDVGKQLLESKKGGSLDAEWIAENAMGYGNHASFMTTTSSAPTHTVTALWHPGKFNGEPWIPLLLRRGYRKHLVLG